MLLAAAAVLASGLAGVALLLRGSRRAAAAVAVAGFLAFALLILLIGPDERLPVGELLLGVAPFVKLWTVSAALALIGLTLVDSLGAGTSAGPAPAMLFIVAATGALLIPEPGAQIFLALAAGLATLGALVDAPRAVEGGIRSLTLAGGLIVAGICLATGPLGQPPSAAQTSAQQGLGGGAVVGGAAILGGVALGLGVFPLHRAVIRLAESAPLAWAPLAVAFTPAVLALVAQPWLQAAAAPSGIDAAALGLLARAVALAGIGAASIALLIQDDAAHALPYAFAAEAAFALLALAVPADEAAAAAFRVRLLVLPLAAAPAWAAAAALRVAFDRSRMADLAGWTRVLPFAGLAFVAAAVAAFGLPGTASWEARARIAEAAFGATAGTALVVASPIPVAIALARALAAGLAPPRSAAVRQPRGQARRRDPWRGPLAAIVALGLGLLAVAVAVGVGGVAGAAVAPLGSSGAR